LDSGGTAACSRIKRALVWTFFWWQHGPPALARKGQQILMPAVLATNPGEAFLRYNGAMVKKTASGMRWSMRENRR